MASVWVTQICSAMSIRIRAGILAACVVISGHDPVYHTLLSSADIEISGIRRYNRS